MGNKWSKEDLILMCERLKELVESDACEHPVTGEIFDGIGDIMNRLLDAEIDYDTAAKISHISKQALTTRISRSIVHPIKRRLLRYSDLLKLLRK